MPRAETAVHYAAGGFLVLLLAGCERRTGPPPGRDATVPGASGPERRAEARKGQLKEFLRFRRDERDLGRVSVTRIEMIFPEGVFAPERTSRSSSVWEFGDGYLIQGSDDAIYRTDREGKLLFERVPKDKTTGYSFTSYVGADWFGYKETKKGWNTNYHLFDMQGQKTCSIPLPRACTVWPAPRAGRILVLRWLGMDGWTKQGPTIYDTQGELVRDCQYKFKGMQYVLVPDGSLVVQDAQGIAWISPDGAIAWRSPADGMPRQVSADGKYVLISAYDRRGNESRTAVLDGRGRVVFRTELREFGSAWFLEDGKHMFFQHKEARELYRIGEWERVWSCRRYGGYECLNDDGSRLAILEMSQNKPGEYTKRFALLDMTNGEEILGAELPFEETDSRQPSLRFLGPDTVRCFVGAYTYLIRVKNEGP